MIRFVVPIDRLMTTLSYSLRFRHWASCLSVLAFFGCFLISQSSASQEVVEVTVNRSDTIEVSLPKLKAPLKPVDDQVRVALSVSVSPDLSVYAVKLPTKDVWDVYSAARVRGVAGLRMTCEQLVIALTKPSTERLGEIMQSFFPHTTIYRRGDAPESGDIRFDAQVIPEFVESDLAGIEGQVVALKVRILIKVTDPEGRQIATIEASSRGVPQFRMSWSIKSSWTAVTKNALNEAFDALIRAIPPNQPLKLRLAELAEGRALPASLATTASFSDDTALLSNGKLDAGDEGILNVRVSNQGLGQLTT